MAKITATSIEDFKLVEDFIKALPKEIGDKIYEAEYIAIPRLRLRNTYKNETGNSVILPKGQYMELTKGAELYVYDTGSATYYFDANTTKYISFIELKQNS